MSHAFERANLGKAPFRCVGYFESVWQAHQGAPLQPGTSCDYCGQGIRHAFRIRAADGFEFKVGSDCVMRTGDAGLIKASRTLPEVKQARRAQAQARDAAIVAEWTALMGDAAATAALAAKNICGKDSWLDYAKRVWPMCGAAGRKRYLKEAKRIIAAPEQAA